MEIYRKKHGQKIKYGSLTSTTNRNSNELHLTLSVDKVNKNDSDFLRHLNFELMRTIEQNYYID